MLDLVKDLFKAYDFSGIETNIGILFMPKESSLIKTFWLVVPERDINSIIDRQSELLDSCKAICIDPAMDKNVSMLILWETSGGLDHIVLSKMVMAVEEDPYFFKKYVLYFSAQERDELRKVIGNKSFSDYIKEHIESTETFATYKKDPHAQSWHSLFYRTAMKLPFIKLEVGSTDGLESLFTRNDQAVANANNGELVGFDKNFFLLMKDKTPIGIKEDTPEKLLADLLTLLGGTSNDN
jgi:hypothetical protein